MKRPNSSLADRECTSLYDGMKGSNGRITTRYTPEPPSGVLLKLDVILQSTPAWDSLTEFKSPELSLRNQAGYGWTTWKGHSSSSEIASLFDVGLGCSSDSLRRGSSLTGASSNCILAGITQALSLLLGGVKTTSSLLKKIVGIVKGNILFYL